jgi:hypothetical protein
LALFFGSMSHLHFTRHEIVPSILLCLRDSSTPLPVLAAQRTKIHAKSAPPPRIDARVPLRAAAIANRLMKADRTVRGSERRGGRARLNAPDSKSGIPLRVSGVRIPPSPPRIFIINNLRDANRQFPSYSRQIRRFPARDGTGERSPAQPMCADLSVLLC